MRITFRLSTVLLLATSLAAQTPTATINGRVVDQTKASIAGARVEAINVATNAVRTATTNEEGLFSVVNLQPGVYRVEISKPGFRTIVKPDVTLHVQDAIALNFSMSVGAASESITVQGGAPLVNSESAAVGTVVDRQFVGNLPLNGRSFQSLLQLTPGVVLTPTTGDDSGQFSVNGQRATANYFMIDGVSANIGVVSFHSGSQGAAGAIPGFSALGGTNNLVSVDALEEFRIQTSTFAPEFGRTPGAQVSIETRSGSNNLHGTIFDYFRNDVLDANDWFANNKGLPKAAERQNDFGGTLGGPLWKNRTFFFFSYEGLRLRLPQTVTSIVPSVSSRQAAPAAIRPYLDAYPIPNGPDLGNGNAEFNSSHSDSATLDATSLRIDHRLGSKLSVFGRFNHSPSENVSRGAGRALSTANHVRIKTQTLTLGGVWSISPIMSNDFRFNYSKNRASSFDTLDDFGGAIPPPQSLLFPSDVSAQNASFAFTVFNLTPSSYFTGNIGNNVQRQINLVDNLSLVHANHSLRFGVDYRRLSPHFEPRDYSLQVAFFDVQSATSLSPFFAFLVSSVPATIRLHNLGIFAQDTWKPIPKLAITYGARWDIDFTPTTVDSPDFLAVRNVEDLSALSLAPAGTPIYDTKYGNFAPRIGIAYQLSSAAGRESALRGGFGVFYDLASQQIGDTILSTIYPFSGTSFTLFPPFPLPPSVVQRPEISIQAALQSQITAFDPDLKAPYSLQWNGAFEQAFGQDQSVSLTYIGALGRRLLQQEIVLPGATIAAAQLVRNTATSDYHALQTQFRRRMSRGIQAVASYTWSHSIDSASSSSRATQNLLPRDAGRNVNRGHSDFDIRHSFSVGVTWNLPAPTAPFLHHLGSNWSLDSIVQARSGRPVDVFLPNFFQLGDSFVSVRPDVLSGVPLYVDDPAVAGGRRINSAAFTNPPTTPAGCDPGPPSFDFPCNPNRQGNLGRNALRGFPAAQWDLAVRREFPIREGLKLQFRAELFNVLNHPNFADPSGTLGNPLFGQSAAMLAKGIGGTPGTGGFSPIYQVGGPRAIQLALKLQF